MPGPLRAPGHTSSDRLRPNGRRRSAAALLVLVALAAGLAGCGYQWGYRALEGVDTVAVPVFDNRTTARAGGSRRELEVELTRAVVREVQRRTALRVTGDPDRADAVVRGALVAVTESVVVEGADDEVLLSSARFEVEVRVLRAGTVIRSERLVEVAELVPGSGRLGTSAEALAPAADEAFRRLAERIVMLLEG